MAEPTLVLLAAVAGSLVVADVAFTLTPVYPDYVAARLGFEYLVAEARALSHARDKRSERRRRKIMPKLEEARRRLSRYSLLKLLLVLPLYAATAFVSMSQPIAMPVACCVPVIAHEVEGLCLTTGPMLVALAYIMLLPMVQESPLLMLMLKRGWVEGVAQRLERW